jgi:TRAP-type C4-dicarboxylate transport system permease small subunit
VTGGRADRKVKPMLSVLHSRVEAVLVRIENVAAIGAGCAVVAAMVLVSLDAVMRHVLASPLTFQLHLTQYYLLVSMALLALPWGYRNGGAIQIRLLIGNLPRRLAEPIVRLGLLAAAVYLTVLAWEGYQVFHEALVQNEVIMGVIDWPVAWSWIWVPVGCGLLALRLVLDATEPQLRPIGAAHD